MSKLPPLKEAVTKFSSWSSSFGAGGLGGMQYNENSDSTKNGGLDQVDELLIFENESLTPNNAN